MDFINKQFTNGTKLRRRISMSKDYSDTSRPSRVTAQEISQKGKQNKTTASMTERGNPLKRSGSYTPLENNFKHINYDGKKLKT
jgi:hypothetical protein